MIINSYGYARGMTFLRLAQKSDKYSVEMHGDGGFTISLLPIAESAQQVTSAEKAETAQVTADPSYRLTQEQIRKLKSGYSVSDISTDQFQQMMEELMDMGVISGNDRSYFGPWLDKDGFIHGGTRAFPGMELMGAQKTEGDNRFNRDWFQGRNIFSWIDAYTMKNESCIDWFKNTTDPLFSDVEKMKNIAAYQQFNRDFGRIKNVLDQLR